MFSKLFIFTLKRLFVLIVAGIVISLLHAQDFLVMLILAFFTGLIYFRKRKSKHNKVYYLGFFISAIGGILAENWGIQSGLWTYHDLSGSREFPYWLPFAWGLAFSFLYSFEAYYIKVLQITQLKSKIFLTLFATVLLPTVGEIVTVQLGVWTYAGDYKILGIPLYAIGLLVLFHTATFLLLYTINLSWKVSDPVFTRNSKALHPETHLQ